MLSGMSVLFPTCAFWSQVHVLVQLALADLLAAVVLLYSSAINKVSIDQRLFICQYSLPLSVVRLSPLSSHSLTLSAVEYGHFCLNAG